MFCWQIPYDSISNKIVNDHFLIYIILFDQSFTRYHEYIFDQLYIFNNIRSFYIQWNLKNLL